MRSFEAVIVCLACTIASFFSVLAALDDNPSTAIGIDRPNRMALFATPDLAAVSPASLSTLRPGPTTIALDAPPGPSMRNQPMSATAKSRSAHVPPIVRRQPKQLDERASGSEAGFPKPIARASATPPFEMRVSPARAPAFDTSSRSTLGGPRPGSEAVPSKVRAPMKAKPVSKTEGQ